VRDPAGRDVPAIDPVRVLEALAELGGSEPARRALFGLLRDAEARAADPAGYRDTVRWPLIQAALAKAGTHRVVLRDGLVLDVSLGSRIERALLLSAEEHPHHVWEPQTTKLLIGLAAEPAHVIVGGAYIGDQALPLAWARGERPGATVHAFEAMRDSFERLVRNIALNGLRNVVPQRLALWDQSGLQLGVAGPLALASCGEPLSGEGAELVSSITIDDYIAGRGLDRVGLVTLDLEGGEERALRGARALLGAPPGVAPDLVFEVHRHYADWSRSLEHVPTVALAASHGYSVYAIRDYHDNIPMEGRPIEVIPVDSVYLEGPPHGFNVLAFNAGTPWTAWR
jgi:FkbM family methyltransferase